MKASTETMIVLGGVLLAVLLTGQERRNEWKAGYSSTPGMVYFGIEWSKPGSHSSYSSDMPLSAFRGLNPAQSGPAKFEYAADAGTFVCQGRFSFGSGSGTYSFQPNPRFAAELQQLGYDAPRDNDRLFSMALSQITLDFARGIRDAGLRASTDQLVELRSHGVSLPYIRETQLTGYRNFTPKDYVEMKIHGVCDGISARPEARRLRPRVPSNRRTENSRNQRGLHARSGRLRPEAATRRSRADEDPRHRTRIHSGGPRSRLPLHRRRSDRSEDSRRQRSISAKPESSGIRDLSAQQITQLKIHGVRVSYGLSCCQMRTLLLALLSLPLFGQANLDFLNHNRPVLDAHNCYPYKGDFKDRIDRALKTGIPRGHRAGPRLGHRPRHRQGPARGHAHRQNHRQRTRAARLLLRARAAHHRKGAGR